MQSSSHLVSGHSDSAQTVNQVTGIAPAERTKWFACLELCCIQSLSRHWSMVTGRETAVRTEQFVELQPNPFWQDQLCSPIISMFIKHSKLFLILNDFLKVLPLSLDKVNVVLVFTNIIVAVLLQKRYHHFYFNVKAVSMCVGKCGGQDQNVLAHCPHKTRAIMSMRQQSTYNVSTTFHAGNIKCPRIIVFFTKCNLPIVD
jgi:hypothetical protein